MKYLIFFLLANIINAEEVKNLYDNFDAQITIQKNEDIVSKGNIRYRENDFFYEVELPYSQKIIGINQNIYVQDDDFNQVHVYKDNASFLLRDVLKDENQKEYISCPTVCYKILLNEETGFSEALIVAFDQIIEYIQATDIQNVNYLIKFENFKVESSKIVYEPPEDYSLVKND